MLHRHRQDGHKDWYGRPARRKQVGECYGMQQVVRSTATARMAVKLGMDALHAACKQVIVLVSQQLMRTLAGRWHNGRQRHQATCLLEGTWRARQGQNAVKARRASLCVPACSCANTTATLLHLLRSSPAECAEDRCATQGYGPHGLQHLAHRRSQRSSLQAGQRLKGLLSNVYS